MGSRRQLRFDRGTTAGLGAILLWSFTAALTRSLTEQLGLFRAAAAVYVVAGSLCLAHLVVAPRKLRQLRELPVAYVAGCGSLFVFYMVGLVMAIGRAGDRGQVLEITLVNYLWCPLTLLLSTLLLGKRARALVIPGTALVLVGLFLVLIPDASASWTSMASHIAGRPLPYGLALAVAVAWALYSNLTRRLAGTERVGGVLLFLPATGALLLVLSFAISEEGAWTTRAVVETVFLGSSTAGAYFLWDYAMRTGDIVLVATGSYFLPLLATLVSGLYLAVAPGMSLWLGCACIVIGSLMSWLSITDPPPKDEAAPSP